MTYRRAHVSFHSDSDELQKGSCLIPFRQRRATEGLMSHSIQTAMSYKRAHVSFHSDSDELQKGSYLNLFRER